MLQHQVFKFLCSNLNNRISARLSAWKGISTISDGSTDQAPAAPAASSGPARLRTTLDCFGMAWHWFLRSGCWNSMRSSSLVWWSHQVMKRWSLLIGEPKAATASTAKKRTTVKRIGSMADMQCFLKFIRVFRQSGGVSGKFARPWVSWLCKCKQTKLAEFKKNIDFHPCAIRLSVSRLTSRIETWFSHPNTETQGTQFYKSIPPMNSSSRSQDQEAYWDVQFPCQYTPNSPMQYASGSRDRARLSSKGQPRVRATTKGQIFRPRVKCLSLSCQPLSVLMLSFCQPTTVPMCRCSRMPPVPISASKAAILWLRSVEAGRAPSETNRTARIAYAVPLF